mgnify:CR=1 FL=1
MGSDDENAADLNRIWDVEQNITSIYSSAYNPDYQTFRQKTFGLEEPFRNGMMQSVSKNPVFQRMMGVRYIVSDSDVPGYTLVKKCGTTGIYQNKDAAPVMYATDRVMTEEEYKKLFGSIRPEIIELARKDQEYWMAKYNPLIGDIQDWIYDLYLKGNKIESGRKNYSEVIGLLISYNEWKKESNK